MSNFSCKTGVGGVIAKFLILYKSASSVEGIASGCISKGNMINIQNEIPFMNNSLTFKNILAACNFKKQNLNLRVPYSVNPGTQYVCSQFFS